MITRFEVSNFKSIKQLGLDMRHFMVLVGPNGAGKTNLVQALQVCGEILHRGTVEPIQEHGYEQLIRRGRKPARGLRFTLQVELPTARLVEMVSPWHLILNRTEQDMEHLQPLRVEVSIGVEGSISTDEVWVADERLRLHSGKSTLEVTLDKQGVTVRSGEDPDLLLLLANEISIKHGLDRSKKIFTPELSREQIEQMLAAALSPHPDKSVDRRLLKLINWQRRPSPWMGYLRDLSRVTRLRLDASALRRDSSFEDTRSSLLGPTGEGLALAIARLRGTRSTPSPHFRKVLEALQEVYPRIEDVMAQRIPSGRLMLLFKERGITEPLGQSSISDGVLHALALLVALQQGTERGEKGVGLLAIEEPENAIHPWPLRRLLTHAQQAQRQVLLTTHSETAVNAVTDPESLFIAESDDRRGTVITQATRREAALRSILEESGQRLGDVWLDGSLGGVPGAEP